MVPPSTNPVKLILVDGLDGVNSNKFYHMFPNGESFDVEFGRVGATLQKSSYPISKWSSKYKEKIKKGYKDVTDLVKTNKVSSGYKTLNNPKIDNLFQILLGFAKQSVQNNYVISSDAVTVAQVVEAQGILDELTKLAVMGISQQDVNKLLLRLYTIIPRKMNNVKNYIIHAGIDTATELQSFRKIIDSEQATLDVMNGQVKIRGTTDTVQQTILDALGLVVEVGDGSDEQIVKNLMGHDQREYKAVYKVIHDQSRTRYNRFVDSASYKRQELFWHGSRNENWISILQTGLKIRPSNAILTGAMFGHGIYFADKYRKSANYTSLSGSYWAKGSANKAFIALMKVHLGNPFEIIRHTHDCYNLDKERLKKKGDYDSVFAKGGADLVNNEYIVYDDAQSTIEYLIEIGN
jgi:poly [ADP-ribose] polymerase